MALPKEAWPAHWEGKYHCPVVLLKRALYGHPGAGGFWEQHCEERLFKAGFEIVGEWPSLYCNQSRLCWS